MRLLKEETERRQKEEAERLKAEMQERLKNEEKEREVRRKRVEAIMLRTRGKTSATSTPQVQLRVVKGLLLFILLISFFCSLKKRTMKISLRK